MLPAHTWSQMNLHQRVAACNADISEHPQFGRLTGVVFMGDVIIDDTPTAATNGRDVMYGNAFCGKLNQKQLRYVDLHENMHKSLRHTTLYQDIVKRFPDESNRAQDYVINGLIEEIDLYHDEAILYSKSLAEFGDKVSGADKSAIESAIADLKSTLEGSDAEAVKEKTNALSQAAMKLGEAMYKAQQGQAEADAARDAGAAGGGADDVVDADFEEVKDDDKKA